MSARADQPTQFRRMTRPPSLVELVAADLREGIVLGRLRPGERISDVRVAKAMGISRAPVREALAQLAARGLVEEMPRRGTFVAQLTRIGAEHVYDCRRALEGLAARRIAEQAELAGPTARLREIVDDMDNVAGDRDPLAMAEIDHRFHMTLCDLTGNSWLVRLYEQLADQSLMMQALDSVAHAQADTRELAMRHAPIVDAIATGAPDEAERAIVEHIDLSERLFLNEVPDIFRES